MTPTELTLSVNDANFWMQHKAKEPGLSREQYSKSKTAAPRVGFRAQKAIPEPEHKTI